MFLSKYTKNNNRQSNIELLRILAMFLVLVVHADFNSLGLPDKTDLIADPVNTSLRVIFQVLSIGCVNIFIMISGWFEAKATIRGFATFCFQCVFFLLGVYIILVLFNIEPLSNRGMLSCFLFVRDPDYWFIKSYLVFYCLLPILNSYIRNTEKKQFRDTIIALLVLQSIYNWIAPFAEFYVNGYSPLSFILLYMIARYCRIYHESISVYQRKQISILYITTIVLLFGLSMGAVYQNNTILLSILLHYENPMVILYSLLLLLLFCNINFKSKLINYIAVSSFSVYLLHTHLNLFDRFKSHIQNLYNDNNGGGILLFLISVFVVSVVFDKIRILIWCLIENKYLKWK